MDFPFDGGQSFPEFRRELKGIPAEIRTGNLYFPVRSGILRKRSYPTGIYVHKDMILTEK